MKSSAEVPPICNMCGLSCVTEHIVEQRANSMGLIDCEVHGTYFSTPGNGDGALDDMTSYTFTLCEFCLDHMFTRFKVPPAVMCYIDNAPEDFQPAEQRVKEDDFRRHKEEFYSEKARRDAARSEGVQVVER